MVLTFFVPGVAKTKGSVIAGKGGGIRQSVIGSTRWARIAEDAARAAVERVGWQTVTADRRVRIGLVFVLPVDPLSVRSGDGDKLERNIWDALTKAAIWADDVQVCDWAGARRQVGEDGLVEVGVWVTVDAPTSGQLP